VSESRIQIFISHSSLDAELAKKLVRELEAVIDIPRGAIRCTSVSGNQLEPGAHVAPELLRDLQECSVVIALLTHDSLASSFMLMELGAAWLLGKTACPLLAPGLSSEDLPGPFQLIQAMQLGDSDSLPRLFKKVASVTGLPLRTNQPIVSNAPGDFAQHVNRLPSWGRRCLSASAPYGLVAAISAAIFGYAACSFRSQAPYSVHLLTGNAGGRFDSLGTWLRNEIKSHADADAELTLERTQGSVDNCDRIELSEANTVALAWTSQQCGESKDHPERKARVLAALYPEVLHFLVHKDTDSPGSVPDLRSKKVYFGNERSGTRSSAMRLLSKAGYKRAEVDELVSMNSKLGNLEFESAADYLRKGEIDAAFFGTGLGARAVKLALQDGSVRLVSLASELVQQITKDDEDSHFAYASLENDEKLKGAYDPNPYGLTNSGYLAVNRAAGTPPFKFDSIASNVVLLATESVDKQFVELLLKSLYGSKPDALVSRGVSRTYLEQSSLLNERMTEKGIRLNTGVNDYHAWWSPNVKWRRLLAFSGGVIGIFAVVTVVMALLRFVGIKFRFRASGWQLGSALREVREGSSD